MKSSIRSSTPTVLWLLMAIAVLCGAIVGCATKATVSNDRPKAVDYYVEGFQAYQKGNREAAIAALTRANEANPDLTMSRTLLGDLYRTSGDYHKAAEQYEATVRLDPYGAINHYNLAVSYQFLNRLQESLAAYFKALKLNPGDMNTNMNLGLVYLTLGDVNNAIKYTEIATQLDDSSAIAFANFGVALDAGKQLGRAEGAYRKSLDLNPDQPTTILNLATNLIAQGKPGEAIPVLNRVPNKSDSASIRKSFGDAYAQAGRFDDAVAEYTASLKIDPKYYPAMNDMGRVLVAKYHSNLQMDEEIRKNAIKYWRASLSINPNQPKIESLIKEWERSRL